MKTGFVRLVMAASAAAALAAGGCGKGGGDCTGISNPDPLAMCLQVPAADYKAGEASKYERGGQMSITGASQDKGTFLIGWSDDFGYALKTHGIKKGNATKPDSKVTNFQSGTLADGGEWYSYDLLGMHSVVSIVKQGSRALTCSGNIGTTSAAVANADACKTIR